MSAEVFATAVMAAEMLTSAGGAAGMRAPSPAVTMATTFWAGQRQARQRNREDCDGNDAKKSHGGCSMRVPFGETHPAVPGSLSRNPLFIRDHPDG